MTGIEPIVVDQEKLNAAPKVLLHDHLDGGVRVGTVLELAREVGYADLPALTSSELSKWFVSGGNAGSLVEYLKAFDHTVAVMQTEKALRRVAREAVEDLVADGVVYAEIRYAPELFISGGLSMAAAVEAVQAGFAEGMSSSKRFIKVCGLLCGLRQNETGREVAELAVRYSDIGVVGFDIAGPEVGFPPSRVQEAFDYLRAEHSHYTIHAGEADGLRSIDEALTQCGAERLGHGTRIIDDVSFDEDGTARLGSLAQYVLDRRIPLELCPTSNVQTKAAASIAEHPFDTLYRLGFVVTVNTDNRLMSDCSVSSELAKLIDAFGYDLNDLETFAVNAMQSAFLSYPERQQIIEDVIRPAFARLR